MLFSERKEISDKYEKWIQENKAIKDCPFSVVTYLDMFGYLTPPKREVKIVKYENGLTKDDVKQALDTSDSFISIVNKNIDKVVQELNQLLYKIALSENKTPDQVYQEMMNHYVNKPWDEVKKELKGENDGKRDS